MDIPSLYIHVPFCKRKCFYCNFYSEVHSDRLADDFVDSVASQLNKIDHSVSTIYIGGGTPTALSTNALKKLLAAVKKFSNGASEYTVEANPESLNEEKGKVLLDYGVNRISIGVQSFDDKKLKKLGRIHNAAKAREAFRIAHRQGFKNISIDLIFGLWGEKVESWKQELEEAARLPVNHVSCYEITYEKETPLYEALKNKSVMPIAEDETRRMYELAIDTLALGGLKQYEVSNFAKEGFESRHNINYWCNNDYLGLGPSAFSYIGGVRWKNIADIAEYLNRLRAFRDIIEFSEKLSPERSAKETAAVKIRTRDGILFKWFQEKTGFDFLDLEGSAIKDLLDKDLIKYKKENNIPIGVMLKRKGLLLCDTVSSALL